jgi:hypothetical protein
LTVYVWPATRTVPVRSPPAFVATVSVIVPFPVCVPVVLMEIHGVWLAAVQTHPASDAIETSCLPPAAATWSEARPRLNVQGSAA